MKHEHLYHEYVLNDSFYNLNERCNSVIKVVHAGLYKIIY